MKSTILTTAAAGMAAFAFTAMPVSAADESTKPSATAVAAQTTTVYIVQITGKG